MERAYRRHRYEVEKREARRLLGERLELPMCGMPEC
jgi:hypothetical protein